jgi:catechol 2,3-dioxygenase-like lactoylglutathione lyase family enzyme
MLGVALSFPVDGAARLAFRPLTGADERAASGHIRLLLGRLAVAGAGLVAGEMLDRLTIGDRDRALAAFYRDLFGSRIIADTTCSGCGKAFELRFDLDELIAARQPDGSAEGDRPAVTVGKARYRLPTMADLYGKPEDMLDRLHLDGPPANQESVEAAIEAADPALALDLSGSCPECGQEQVAPFSIAGFLSAAMRRDSSYLLHEVHLIARSYAWDLDTILGLTRDERQALVQLIIADADARAGIRRLA